MLKKTFFITILFLIEIQTISSQVLYQAILLHEKDTLTMWEKFLDYSYNITSIKGDMELSTCFGYSFSPTWRIENDSLFLIEIRTDRGYEDNDKAKYVDLKKQFKDKCINNRIFGKEVNFQIEARHNLSESFPVNDSAYNYDKTICFTIKNGILTSKEPFEDKTEYIDRNFYLSQEAIWKNTDWKNLPPFKVDRLVTVRIKTNDTGKIIDAFIVKNKPWGVDNIIKMEGEDVWNREALRQVKLIPKWDVVYKCGQVVDKEDDLMFLFTKPR